MNFISRLKNTVVLSPFFKAMSLVAVLFSCSKDEIDIPKKQIEKRLFDCEKTTTLPEREQNAVSVTPGIQRSLVLMADTLQYAQDKNILMIMGDVQVADSIPSASRFNIEASIQCLSESRDGAFVLYESHNDSSSLYQPVAIMLAFDAAQADMLLASGPVGHKIEQEMREQEMVAVFTDNSTLGLGAGAIAKQTLGVRIVELVVQ